MVQQSRRVERLVPTSTQAATGGESALSPHDLQKQAALETGPPRTCFQPLQCSPFISLGTVLQRLTRFAAPPVKSQPPSFPERRLTHVSPPSPEAGVKQRSHSGRVIAPDSTQTPVSEGHP